MRNQTFVVKGKLQIFDMASPWIYLPIPPEKVPDVRPGGWGSIPIYVTIGKTTWKTSMFPLKNEGYFIPVKKLVCKKENLKVGDLVTVRYSPS